MILQDSPGHGKTWAESYSAFVAPTCLSAPNQSNRLMAVSQLQQFPLGSPWFHRESLLGSYSPTRRKVAIIFRESLRRWVCSLSPHAWDMKRYSQKKSHQHERTRSDWCQHKTSRNEIVTQRHEAVSEKWVPYGASKIPWIWGSVLITCTDLHRLRCLETFQL